MLTAEWTTEKEFDRPSTYKEELGTTQKTTQKINHLKKFQKLGIITRVGADNGGALGNC